MPFTREITDIKVIIKKIIEEFLMDDSFVKIFTEKIERKLEIKETQKKVRVLEKRYRKRRVIYSSNILNGNRSEYMLLMKIRMKIHREKY